MSDALKKLNTSVLSITQALPRPSVPNILSSLFCQCCDSVILGDSKSRALLVIQ